MEPGLTVGISGASGAALALSFLKLAYESGVPTELIVTPGGERTLREELGLPADALREYVRELCDCHDIGAAPASGSRASLGMVVIPCSMRTLAGIAAGYSENLLLRAADVTLKERRRLVLVTREAPLPYIHLRNMQEVTRAGGIIFPPVPLWYAKPCGMDEMHKQLAARILGMFGVHTDAMPVWAGE